MSDPRTGLRCVVTSSPARRPRCCVPLRSALCFLYARSLPSHPHSLPPIRALPRLPPRNAPRLHSRTSKGLRRTKGYFRGSEAVSWLVKRYPVQCKDRATAVEVSDQLANLGTFNRIKPANAEGFADSKKYIYRFAPILDKLHIQGALSDRASACRACPHTCPCMWPACVCSFIFSHIFNQRRLARTLRVPPPQALLAALSLTADRRRGGRWSAVHPKSAVPCVVLGARSAGRLAAGPRAQVRVLMATLPPQVARRAGRPYRPRRPPRRRERAREPQG